MTAGELYGEVGEGGDGCFHGADSWASAHTGCRLRGLLTSPAGFVPQAQVSLFVADSIIVGFAAPELTIVVHTVKTVPG